jgi:hypothetical protein
MPKNDRIRNNLPGLWSNNENHVPIESNVLNVRSWFLSVRSRFFIKFGKQAKRLFD